MRTLSEKLLLPYIRQLGMELSDGPSYRNCGRTFCCRSEIGDGFCWELSGGDRFSVSVYDLQVDRDMAPEYDHPAFFTIGSPNEHTAKYVLGSARKNKILSYAMPEGTFSGIFPKGTHVKNASLSFSPEFIREQTRKYRLDHEEFLRICFSQEQGCSDPDAGLILKQIFSARPSSRQAEMYYEAKIMELFSVLLQWSERRERYAAEGIQKHDLDALHEVTAYMDEHYHDQINIGDLEKIAYMGKNKLSYLFKAREGVSITEYLRMLRIDKAKELLVMTSTPISLIAQAVGYQNQGSFAERFRMETGMTPTEYRSQATGCRP